MGHFTLTDTPHRVTSITDDSLPPAIAPSPEELEGEPGEAPEPASPTDALLVQILALLQQLVDKLFNEPGTPRSVAGHLSTMSSDYQTVASWVIPANLAGQLEELSFTSDDTVTIDVVAA